MLISQMVNLETYNKKTKYAGVITSVIAILNILLNICGVKLWDYRAVCYVTVICQIAALLLHYRFSGKMGIRDIIKPIDLIMYIILSIALIPISLLLYLNLAVRVVCIAVLVFSAIVLIILNRTKIRGFIRKLKDT